MRSVFRLTTGVMALAALTACTERLDVLNPNSPDRARALGRPADLENFIGGCYNSVHSATLAGFDNLQTAFQVQAFENFSGLANANMGPRGAMPRNPVDNSRGNGGTASLNGPWFGLQVAAKIAAVGIQTIAAGTSLGSVGADLRARSFAYFCVGLANTMLAAGYDSVTIVRPGSGDAPPIVARTAGATYGLAALDTAIALLDSIDSRAAGTAFPGNWLNAGVTSTADMRRVMRSHRARMRISQPRNPTEAAAIDWASVLADATNGITADLTVNMNPSGGWFMNWIAQNFAGPNWHVMTPFVLGMADTTGAFAGWLNTALQNRSRDNPSFVAVMQTYDNRMPTGASRAAQQAAPGRYFENRASDGDANDGGWGFSAYSNIRFRAFNSAGRVGAFPVFTVVENRMIQAEALMRLGQPGAGALIATSRSAAGLSNVAALNATTDAVGSVGNQCVPRVPSSSNGTTYTLACPTLFEAMKWEKRMETQFTYWGSWFFDSRRWGDLADATPLQFPIPWSEFDAPLRASSRPWNGDRARDGAASRGTYGY